MNVLKIKINRKLYNGGYLSYWKFYFSFPLKIYKNKLFTKSQKFWFLYEMMFYNSLWILFIKPIGFIFHIQKIYKGTILNRNKFNVTKKTILWLFRIIPFWYWKTNKLTDNDKNYLLK